MNLLKSGCPKPKRRIIAASLAGMALVLATAGSAQADNRFMGAYLGAQAGWTNFSSKISGKEVGGNFSYTEDGLAANGLSTGFFAGAGFVDRGWYLGLQANYQQHDAEYSQQLKEPLYQAGAKLEFDKSFGIDLRLGKQVADNILFYGLIGWQKLKLEAEIYETGEDTASSSQSLEGARVGLGLEYATENRVFTRFEYAFTQYKAYEEVFDDGVDQYKGKLKPDEQSFHVAIGYRF